MTLSLALVESYLSNLITLIRMQRYSLIPVLISSFERAVAVGKCTQGILTYTSEILVPFLPI